MRLVVITPCCGIVTTPFTDALRNRGSTWCLCSVGVGERRGVDPRRGVTPGCTRGSALVGAGEPEGPTGNAKCEPRVS